MALLRPAHGVPHGMPMAWTLPVGPCLGPPPDGAMPPPNPLSSCLLDIYGRAESIHWPAASQTVGVGHRPTAGSNGPQLCKDWGSQCTLSVPSVAALQPEALSEGLCRALGAMAVGDLSCT
jgi:hypothetical protein